MSLGWQIRFKSKFNVEDYMRGYNFRNIERDSTGNGIISTPLDPLSNGIIILIRYCEVSPINNIPAYKFWTEFRTDDKELASAGSGIFVNECLWRVEWTIPVAQAAARVEQLRKRMSSAGAFYEYNNIVPVTLAECQIFKMN